MILSKEHPEEDFRWIEYVMKRSYDNNEAEAKAYDDQIRDDMVQRF